MDWTNQTFKQLAERAARRAKPWPKRKYSWEEAASRKLQAASASKQTQSKGINKR